MIAVDKINIELINYEEKLGDSILEFKISGNNINNCIVNTLRRVILNDIPIYAFTKYNIDKNTSIFTEDDIIERLSSMSVWGINNNIDFIENDNIQINKDNEIDKDIIDDDIDINKDNENIDSSSIKQLTMYINYKNKNKEIISITTDEPYCIFYYNQKTIPSPYATPIQLLKLQENQEIILSVITEIGIEQTNANFSPVSIVAFENFEDNDNKYIFKLESRGQITEQRILIVAIINIERKMNKLLNLINKNNELTKLNEGSFTINNEDYTLGELIVSGMQIHKDISFAAYNVAHPLVYNLIIEFKVKNNNIINIINDVVVYYKLLFNTIKNEIIKKL